MGITCTKVEADFVTLNNVANRKCVNGEKIGTTKGALRYTYYVQYTYFTVLVLKSR